jgi:DNA-binding phage protein
MAKSKRKKPVYRNHVVYKQSLNRIIDVLFEKAYNMKMSWPELAKQSGLSRETVVSLGTRKTKYPQFRTVQLIAHAVGGRLDYMKGRVNEIDKYQVTWTPRVFRAA